MHYNIVQGYVPTQFEKEIEQIYVYCRTNRISFIGSNNEVTSKQTPPRHSICDN